jgi:hypothetical protein
MKAYLVRFVRSLLALGCSKRFIISAIVAILAKLGISGPAADWIAGGVAGTVILSYGLRDPGATWFDPPATPGGIPQARDAEEPRR